MIKITTTLVRSTCGSPRVAFAVAALSLTCLSLSTGAMAQTSDVSASKVAAVIPQQVRYTGAFSNRGGDTVEATFRIYATAEGGEAVWTETQQVAVKADGSYSVLLGAASENGLPQGVFAGGQARWLGVSVDSAESLPRTALSSVAYAMKAGDAETVGGVAAANLVTKDDLAKMSQASTTAVQAQTAVQAGVQPTTNPTGSGTADYVALWTTSGNLGNSGIFQAASGFLGIGTTTPGGPLELATSATGGANATLMLEQTNGTNGNYYADLGLYNSNGLIGNLSALGAGYPSGNLFVANDVVFLGGQQNAGTNLIFLTNTSGALKFGTGGYAKTNERMRIGAAGGVSVGNSYVGTDPGAGNLIVSGKVGVGTTAPAAVLEVNGTAKFDGLITFDAGQTFPGTGTITKITASSPLSGGGSSGAITVGLNTTTLESTLNSVYAQLGGADTFTTSATFNQGLVATSTSGGTGVTGSSDTGLGVVGYASSPTAGSAGVLGYAGTTVSSKYETEAARFDAGVWADTSSNNGESVGLLATTDQGYAAIVMSASTSFAALNVDNSNDGDGADIEADGAGTALFAYATSSYAGDFNNSSNELPTLRVYNSGSGGLGTAGKGTPEMFDTFMAKSASGTCGIGGGSMSCTGPVKSLVATGSGQRTVETYAPQAAESWMEDYGTGTMERGVGVVQIDPAFAETVTADASYHVFLTPRGDSPGHLYVTNVTASSFEVRESGDGTSSISFDYKIVAKRRGYESQRLVDVTDRFNAEQAETKRRTRTDIKAPTSKGVVSPQVAGRTAMGGSKQKPGSISASPHTPGVPNQTNPPQ